LARILVIDDDEQVREVLSLMLEHEGYDVITAANGLDGVNLYKENGADLVITDILMPGMGGVQTIMELRLISPEVKVIAISGGDQIAPEYYLRVIKNLGTLHEMKKPIIREELIQAVQALL
jgi:two-component system, OmpR family, response regulator RegX3